MLTYEMVLEINKKGGEKKKKKGGGEESTLSFHLIEPLTIME